MTLLLCLLVSIDPAAARLDALQGTWTGTNASTLVVVGSMIEVAADDGFNGFTARLHAGPRRLRLVDASGMLESRYRIEDGRLRIGEVEYRRRLAGIDTVE
jgi:hypothetical protein